MSKGERIRRLREKSGLTQTALADMVDVSKQNLYKYENDIITNIPSDKIELLARVLNTTPSYIMGWTEDDRRPKSAVPVKVLGRVAAGIPIDAIEDVIDIEEIPESMAKNGSFIGLQIHGHSMEPRICDGDVVIVQRQEDAESGDIVIATVNGDDATCKKLMKYDNGIALVSLNPAFEPMFFTKDEIAEKPIRIIGKVVELRGKF